MRRQSKVTLIAMLALTLAAPATRAASWLMAPTSSRGHHETQARGRNRIASSPRTAQVVARANLNTGSRGTTRLFRPDRPDRTSSPAPPAPLASPPASAGPPSGTIPLRC